MTISIRQLLESAGVPVTDELLREFGTADDAAHPALKQAMKAKRAAEREEKEADFGGMEPPKDYADEDEENVKRFDKRNLPFGGNAWPGLDRDLGDDDEMKGGEDGLGPDGDSRHDRDMSDYEPRGNDYPDEENEESLADRVNRYKDETKTLTST